MMMMMIVGYFFLKVHNFTYLGLKPLVMTSFAMSFSITHKLIFYSTKTCNFTFKGEIVYKKHQLYHTGERKYLCTTCFQAIETERNFKTHLETHKGERPFSCDKCKKKFSKQSGLTYHMEMVHEGKRNYSCSACDRKVSTPQSLKGHEEKCAIKKKQIREQLELKKEI